MIKKVNQVLAVFLILSMFFTCFMLASPVPAAASVVTNTNAFMLNPADGDEIVTFPDPYFEYAIRSSYNLNKPTGDIYRSDMEKLIVVMAVGNGPSQGINNIGGIQYCTNAIEVYLCRNNISDLSPLAGLTSLKKIWASSNAITDVSPLSALINLEGLNLMNNQISDISSLAPLCNLKVCYLAGNQISDISAMQHMHLDDVTIAANQVTDISILTISDNLSDYTDKVNVQYNKLDITPGSNDMDDIQALVSNGINPANIWYSPQGDAYYLNIYTSGNGTVTQSIQGGFGGDGTPWAYFPSNKEVTLDAVPAAGWQFSHWSGSLTGTDPHTTVTMTANMVVYATFIPAYTLTVNIDPAGGGTVTPDPLPVDGKYASGTLVTLTPDAAADYTFSGWTGDTVTDNKITMTGDKTVTAHFTYTPPVTYTLTVHTVGNGHVDTDPSAGQYNPGQVVSVTAVPDANWTFTGWSGDLTGSDNPADITMDGNKDITATFIFSACAINIQCEPAQGGTVTCNPSKQTYSMGEQVTFTANPNSGYHFTGWGGCVASSGTNVNAPFTIDNENCQVIANFAVNNYGGGGGYIGGGLGIGGGSGGTDTKRITSLYGMISQDGSIIIDSRAESADARVWIDILKATKCLNRVGAPISSIIIEKLTGTPSGVTAAGLLEDIYMFSPEGATFDPGITLTFKYDPASLSAGMDEQNLKIVWWDKASGTWVELESTVDTVKHTVSATITHFSYYSIMEIIPVVETPAPVETPVTPVVEPVPTAKATPAVTNVPAVTPATPNIEVKETPAAKPIQIEAVATPEPTKAASTPAVPNVDEPENSNLGTILLSVAGGLLVVVIIVALLISRSRKHQAE